MPNHKVDWEKIPCLPETELKSNWNPVNTRKSKDGLIKLYKCNYDKFEKSCPVEIRKVLMNNGEIFFERNGNDHDHHEDPGTGIGFGVAKSRRKRQATMKKISRISIKIEKKRKERSCLFCLKPCQRLENPENLEEIQIPGAEECPQLRTQLQNFFILRNILELNVSKCEEILKEVDHNSWFMVCDVCMDHVREAWRLHQKILLLRSLEEKLSLLKEEMKQTLLKSEEFDDGDGISLTLENKIRDMVSPSSNITEPNFKIRKQECQKNLEESEVVVKKEVDKEDIMMVDDCNGYDIDLDFYIDSAPVFSPPSPASLISNNEDDNDNDNDFVPKSKPKWTMERQTRRGRGCPKLAKTSIEELKSLQQPTKDIEEVGKAQGSTSTRSERKGKEPGNPLSPSSHSYRVDLPMTKRMMEKGKKQPPVAKNVQYMYSWSCPEVEPIQCDFIGIFPDLLKHMEEVHNFSVDNISESPNDVVAYSTHDFYCDICKRRFATAAFFKKHRALEHPETQNKEDIFHQFPCTHCDLRCPSSRYLEWHLIVKHSTKKMEFECPVCGLEYLTKWKLGSDQSKKDIQMCHKIQFDSTFALFYVH